MANILIVDDSVSIRKMVKFALETAEHNVVEAADGNTGLAEAQQEQYDIVVTDVNMPNMDGIELTRHLRTLPNYKYIPIIMLTTEAMEEKKAEGKAAGVTGWILKPFQPNKLIAVVNKVA